MEPVEAAVAAPEVDAGAVAEVESPEVAEVETPEVEESTSETEEAPAEEQAESEEEQPAEPVDEEELAEWKGSAGARLREMYKKAPGLQKLLDQFPAVRDSIAASFKRDAALRDRNITIAEIDEYRSRCVNGLQDLEAMERSVQEANQLDDAFFTRDRDGNYPGHGSFIENLVQQDKAATLALLKRVPKDWARIDPESYNQTFGAIMQSTLGQAGGIKDQLADIYNGSKDPELQKAVARVWNQLDSFGKRTESNDPEAEKLRRQLQDRDRADSERSEGENQRFFKTLQTEAISNHRKIVGEHSLFKNLPKSITPEKKARMIDDACNRIASHLGKSYSFQNEIKQAFLNRDSKTWHDVDRKGWASWLVNMYVRKVLAEETPGIVSVNKAANAVKKSAAARNGIANRAPAKPGTPAKPGDKRTKPSDFTMKEIMSGAADHLIERAGIR